MSASQLHIHVIADSSGETAARLTRAAQAQFPDAIFTVVRYPRVKDTNALLGVFDQITQARAEHADRRVVVLFTLVREKMASMVERYCVDKRIPFANILGDTLKAIEQATGHEADEVVMRPVAVEADYFDRISAMEFAVRTDDGVAPDAFRDCDICLIGASRSGKTPLSLYLGYVGYKTMNVPLVPGIKPPDELFQIERWRIVGLTIDPERLQQIRQERRPDSRYSRLETCRREVAQAEAMFRVERIPVLSTTHASIEEIASRVLESLGINREMF